MSASGRVQGHCSFLGLACPESNTLGQDIESSESESGVRRRRALDTSSLSPQCLAQRARGSALGPVASVWCLGSRKA